MNTKHKYRILGLLAMLYVAAPAMKWAEPGH